MTHFTIEKQFSAEIEEKKSRFIAHLVPYAEFETKLAVLRREHPKAAHHVTAFRMILDTNQICENAKDDGEPSGTSGMPVLKTMIGAKLIDAGIIVIRYFGGTKLGTGGLARAYTGAAKAVIKTADLKPWHRILRQSINTSFETSSAMEQKISDLGLPVIDRIFNETGVTIIIEGPEEKIVSLNS